MQIIYLILAVIAAVGMWKAFEKAGKPGWAAIIPIYNFIVLLEIAEKPIWWIILLLIPLVNIIVAILVNIEVAKRFGQGTGFGVGLALLGSVFWPILGFGAAQYGVAPAIAAPPAPPVSTSCSDAPPPPPPIQ